ncbi:hypothetical protein Avbf_17149 [Armadillidium vulgare]|nr:hypothetical protein Avbf_17149 [Armadillidium vulgare]
MFCNAFYKYHKNETLHPMEQSLINIVNNIKWAKFVILFKTWKGYSEQRVSFISKFACDENRRFLDDLMLAAKRFIKSFMVQNPHSAKYEDGNGNNSFLAHLVEFGYLISVSSQSHVHRSFSY